MSSPPPDYNPAASILQGGTSAQILPVMGGGGMAPSADYNAGESVLAVGGTMVPITPVSGGGYTMEGGEGDNDPTEDDDDSASASDDSASDSPKEEVPIQIEVYEPFDAPGIEQNRKDYIAKLSEELNIADSAWKTELDSLNASYEEEYKKIRKDLADEQPLYETIPSTVKTIICIQPIGGASQGGGGVASSIVGRAAYAVYAAPSTLMPKRAARLAAAKVEAEKAEADAVAAKSKAAEAETKAKAAEAEAAARDDELSRHPRRVDFAKAAEAAKYAAATARAAAAAAAAALMPKRAAENAAVGLILPDIQDPVTTFLKTFQFLYTQGFFQDTSQSDLRLKKGVCIILYGLFTGDEQQDKILLYLFLKMKQSNKDMVYLLKTKVTPSPPPPSPAAPSAEADLPCPSYVIYGSPIGTFNGIVFTKKKKVDKTYNNYYKVSSGVSRRIEAVDAGTAAAAKGGGGTTDHPLCTTLKGFESSLDKLQLPLENPSYITILRPGVKDRNPLICPDTSDSPFISKAFHSGEENSTYIAGDQKVKLLIDGKAYLIRIATEEGVGGAKGQVKANWENGIFSEGEADLLNDLQLTPPLLLTVFGHDWNKNLATFLDHISNPVYKCYSNVSIIPSRLCDHTRDFINRILREKYKEELHKKISKNTQPGVWPGEFTQIDKDQYTKGTDVVIVSASSGQAGFFQYNEGEKGKRASELQALQEKYKEDYVILF